jgi:hypothetical protein
MIEQYPSRKAGMKRRPAMLIDSQCRTAKCKDKPYKFTDAKGCTWKSSPMAWSKDNEPS